jgi:hypothetical protein
MSPHNYEMKFNGSKRYNKTVMGQHEYYSMFNGSTAKKSISFIPRLFARVKRIFNKTI